MRQRLGLTLLLVSLITGFALLDHSAATRAADEQLKAKKPVLQKFMRAKLDLAQGLLEGLVIEDWLVQFIPAFETVQNEALKHAREVTYGQTTTKIFSPEYLAAELLRSGRLKDQVRVVALIESGNLDIASFHDIIERHGLAEKWTSLAARFDVGE